MFDSLEYRIAKGRIERYEQSDDPVIRASHEAQDCMDCEEFLDKGIRACEALQILELVVRDGIVEGHLEPTSEVKGLVHALYVGWLKRSERAEKWIAKHVENGYHINNLAAFRECCECIQDWLERKDWLGRASRTRQKFAEDL